MNKLTICLCIFEALFHDLISFIGLSMVCDWVYVCMCVCVRFVHKSTQSDLILSCVFHRPLFHPTQSRQIDQFAGF